MEKMVFGKDVNELLKMQPKNVAVRQVLKPVIKAKLCKPAEDAVPGGVSDDEWAEFADEEEWNEIDYDVEGEVPDEGYEGDGYWPDEEPED